MSAVFKRELKAYFTSPIGWIYLAVFYFFAGLFLFLGPVLMLSPSMSAVFSSMQTIVMFLVPILTMRLFSEDKRQKTEQLLLTAPVGLTGIIFGKLLAAFAVFTLGFSATFVYALVLECFGSFEWTIYRYAPFGTCAHLYRRIRLLPHRKSGGCGYRRLCRNASARVRGHTCIRFHNGLYLHHTQKPFGIHKIQRFLAGRYQLLRHHLLFVGFCDIRLFDRPCVREKALELMEVAR